MTPEPPVRHHCPQNFGSLVRMCVMEQTAHIMKSGSKRKTRVVQSPPGTSLQPSILLLDPTY